MSGASKDLKTIQKLLSRIPKGKVVTYSFLAKKLGRPKAYRYAGNLLALNTQTDKYPCYRVVRKDSRVGGYVLGEKEKIRRLEQDGIRVKDRKVINLKDFLSDDLK